MNRTKIEWADLVWNPIRGVCPQGCWYCYAKRFYERFHKDEVGAGIRLEFGEDCGVPREPGKRIFVCSTMELFHPEVPKAWRNDIFTWIEICNWQTFIILTKRPERIDRPMPANVWLGVSVTGPDDRWRLSALMGAMARVRFVSFEPLLADVTALPYPEYRMMNWVIIGRLTGHGTKQNPKREWVQKLVTVARLCDIPVFLKNNLREVWDSRMIQEYPPVG